MSPRRTPRSPHARPKARMRKAAVTLGAAAVTAALGVGAASAGVLPSGLFPDGTPDHVKEKAEAVAAKAADEARKRVPTVPPKATSVPKASKPAGTGPTRKPRPTKPAAAEPKPSATEAPQTTEPKPVEPKPTATTGSTGDSVEAQVIDLVNKERAAAGCAPVTENASLTKAADDYSDVMADSGKLSHTGPDGSTMVTRAEAAGYTGWSTLGENIAVGHPDAAAVMKGWMDSPGHKANILNCSYKEIGVGVHPGDGGPWWTQDFGARR
ncbi:CAP domain-containing protein [Streptomyces sp. NPDC098781]|uniref:CAP domain-containing protein n=1 Tax=Streptomyces sp. NPDC098781 TaxID=3366097 RepID=UPI003824904F